jgi:hypothetical protein
MRRGSLASCSEPDCRWLVTAFGHDGTQLAAVRVGPARSRRGRQSLLYQFGVGLAFLSTVRPDGGPRLHPLCSGELAALRCAATALTATSLASDSER